MKVPFTFILSVLLLLNTFGQHEQIQSNVQNVVVYHSGARVFRTMHIDLKPGTHQIQLSDVSGKSLLSTLKFNNKNITILHKELIKKTPKETLLRLEDQKAALEQELNLLNDKFNDTSFVKEVEELEHLLSLYNKQQVSINSSIRSINKKLDQAKKMEKFPLKNKDGAILQLTLSSPQPIKEVVTLEYLVGGIGWAPHYEIEIENQDAKNLELKFIAKVMSQTGEDWSNIGITLSSAFPLDDPTALPKPDSPWTLDNGRNVKSIEAPERKEQIAELEGVEYSEIKIPASIKSRAIKGKHDLPSNSSIFSFPISITSLPIGFYHYAYPILDPNCFLVAEVTGWDTLSLIDGIGEIKMGNEDVGKSIISFSEFTDTLLIPVGKDAEIFVQRNEVANESFTKNNNVGKKATKQFAYEFEIKNNRSSVVSLKLKEQVPISQLKSIDVEMTTLSGGIHDHVQGEVTWNLDLKPGKVYHKNIEFSVSGDFRNIKRPSSYHTFRTISCPSF